MEKMDGIKPSVQRRLRVMGIDPEAVDDRTIRQLEAMQKAIDDESARIAEAKRTAARGMPITRVAETSGVSRMTLYNKPILKEYAERAIKDAGIEEGRDEVARLKKTLAEKEAIIAGLVKRDGELVEAQMKLRDAKQEIAGLKAAQVEDQRVIVELRKRLAEASQNKSPAKIIHLK